MRAQNMAGPAWIRAVRVGPGLPHHGQRHGAPKPQRRLLPQGVPATEPRTGARITDLPVLPAGLFKLANTRSTCERGAFGSPIFFVGGEIYAGQDRLRYMEEQIMHRQTT